MKIGVLALQGAFAEHIATLEKLKTEAIPVRLPHQLEGLDGLIIPGGESTTITKLMVHYKLKKKIIELAKNNFPIFGTDCPGGGTVQRRRRQTHRSDGHQGEPQCFRQAS
jgi:5'-phosphate synthase pdxT subunit